MTQRQKLKTVIPLSKNLQFWLELSVSLWYMLKLMHNKSCSYSTSIIVYSLNIHVSMPNVVCSMKITFNNRNIIWSIIFLLRHQYILYSMCQYYWTICMIWKFLHRKHLSMLHVLCPGQWFSTLCMIWLTFV